LKRLWREWQEAETPPAHAPVPRLKQISIYEFIIQVLRSSGPLRPSELLDKAEAEKRKKSSVAQAIQRLKEDNKVSVVPEAGRKRDMRLKLT
jgi:hypothetical protein